MLKTLLKLHGVHEPPPPVCHYTVNMLSPFSFVLHNINQIKRHCTKWRNLRDQTVILKPEVTVTWSASICRPCVQLRVCVVKVF